MLVQEGGSYLDGELRELDESEGARRLAEEPGVGIPLRVACGIVRETEVDRHELLSEQVRRAANVVVQSINLPPRTRGQLYREEAERQTYHARRNAQASKSHRKTRRKRLAKLGINPDQIKSVTPKNTQ